MRLRVRFSIRSIMALVLFMAVGFAALRHASDLAASLVLSATLLILGVATLAAVLLRGRRRAFWAGFAAFGWGYAFLGFGPWAADAIRPHLATTKLLEYAGPRIDLAAPESRGFYLYSTLVSRSSATAPVLSDVPLAGRFFTSTSTGAVFGPASEPFLRAGHGLFALILAMLGGAVARRFHASVPRPAPRENE